MPAAHHRQPCRFSTPAPSPLVAPSITNHRTVLLGSGFVGFGLGAVLDVLVFHLVLQWHHLVSSLVTPETLRGLQINLYYDGLFSLAMVGVMGVGGALVWRGLNHSLLDHSPVRALGAVLVGAGVFNVYDGVVDHYVLDIHDAVHSTEALNPHWIGASLLLLGVGILVLTSND